MTRAIARTALVLSLALALAGCSQFNIRSARDPGVDFTRLQTYAWMPLDQIDPADQRVLDRYIDTRIRAAVDRELGAKGYRPATGEPDFFLNYRVSTDAGSAVKGGWRPAHGAGWGNWPAAETLLRENYDAGTLYIAAIDDASKQGIWLGAAQARLLPHVSLERRAERVDDAVRAILAEFPKR
jgi:hypothetical protein